VDAAGRALAPAGASTGAVHGLAVLAVWTVAGLLAATAWFRWDPVPPASGRR
jgi:hypothetical protein